MFQIFVLAIIIVFCVGFLILFPEIADQAPLEAILAAAFLVAQIVYLQVAFSDGIEVGIGRFFGLTYLPLTAVLAILLGVFLLKKGRKLGSRGYLLFSLGLLTAFLVCSLAAFAIWSWSFGFLQ